MKNIKFFKAKQYEKKDFEEISENVFKNKNEYVTSLSFEQEKKYGEGENAQDISQYPLEDILDKYKVKISNFYNELNKENSNVCYLEFKGNTKEKIINLLEIIGKHVYNKKVEKGEKIYTELVIEEN